MTRYLGSYPFILLTDYDFNSVTLFFYKKKFIKAKALLLAKNLGTS